MVDQRISKLAKLFVNYSVNVKPYEKVVIQGSRRAFPLMNELYKECLLSGAYPQILISHDFEHTFYTYAKEHQLRFVSPFARFVVENVDVFIAIFCEPNTKRLTNVDPEKIKMHRASLSELVEIMHRREAEAQMRWGGLPFPDEPEAQEAAMALPEYEDFVYSSCLVDKADPADEWKRIRTEQEKICAFLDKSKEIRAVGDSTDLTFNVRGRKWINCSGEKNMPDGEVFTAPIEDSANGTIRFTFPGIFLGREIEDIRLTFKNGKIVEASAAKGDELLQQLLRIEGAERIGEVAIGTNYGITRFTKNMLFDEKIGGTMHLAIGFNPDPLTGGTNKSGLHWDILKDMRNNGEIYADNNLFYEKGKFLI